MTRCTIKVVIADRDDPEGNYKVNFLQSENEFYTRRYGYWVKCSAYLDEGGIYEVTATHDPVPVITLRQGT